MTAGNVNWQKIRMFCARRQVSLRWLAVLAWMAVIYYFSDQPYSSTVTEQIFGGFNIPVRKAAHAIEYGVLFLLTVFALNGEKRWVALLVCFLYASTDEWHQAYVPGRSAQFNDVLVDTSGAAFAWILLIAAQRLIALTSAQSNSNE